MRRTGTLTFAVVAMALTALAATHQAGQPGRKASIVALAASTVPAAAEAARQTAQLVGPIAGR